MDPSQTAWILVLAAALGIGLVFGLFAAATRYCNMGAVADWVNVGDTGRMRAWILSIAVVIAGVALLEFAGWLDLDQTRANYRMADFPVIRYLLGGLLFGIGMSLAGGCTTRTLVNIGSGNLRAIYVYLLVGLTAAALLYQPTLRGWLDQAMLWPGWRVTALGAEQQDLGALLHAANQETPLELLRLLAAGLFLAALGWLWHRLSHNRLRRRDLIGGLAIGATVLAGWLLTGSPLGQHWMNEAALAFDPPSGLGTQSLTFVGPAAETLRLTQSSPALSALTFGILAMSGVILGAFSWYAFKRQLRWQGFASGQEFVRHTIGAVLMGLGGAFAMGCSIGQGVTGVSTLALGSLLVLISMILGSFITLKLMFYRIVFPEAGLCLQMKAVLTDLHLRPTDRHPLREDIPPEKRPGPCGGVKPSPQRHRRHRV